MLITRAKFLPEVSFDVRFLSPYGVEFIPEEQATVGFYASWDVFDWGRRYQEVQEHLSEGASRLALDELTRQRLLAALHADEAASPRERLTPPKSNEAPKDYAPKAPDAPGTLDETFGLKGKY